MAEPTQVKVQLFRQEGTVPPPDDLIAGSKGAWMTDIAIVKTPGEYKRGMLMMTSANGYVPATKAGIPTAACLCILCEDFTVGENEYVETPAYFAGEFNDKRIILPFETSEDDHAALIAEIQDKMRPLNLYVRHLNE